MKLRSIVSIVVALAFVTSAFAQAEFTADSVKSICKRVASGRLTSKLANGWQLGTYFEGVMALYDMTKEKKYLDSTVAWAAYHTWAGLNGEVMPTNFDNICCYQSYLETYIYDKSAARLANVQNALNYIKNYTYTTCPNKCGDVAWPIVDMYHMAAPSYPRAAFILNDPIIYDSIAKFAVMNAKHHYNVKFRLWNSNCSDTNTTRQWWGRGCGWGVCATCRVHQYLPRNHSGRAWFEQKIRETSAKLLTIQNQTDGMWRSELFTPTMQKEASGSSFFCYQLFYGIRHKILDTATYLGPAKKAWKGLVGCVGVDPARPNLPGYSQGVGGGPSDNFGITNHDEYTEGAFLMAGNEIYKYLTGDTTYFPGDGTPVVQMANSPSQSAFVNHAVSLHCAIGTQQWIDVPKGAKGVAFYSPAGRKLGIQMFTGIAPDHIFAPKGMTASGVAIVKIVY